MSFKVSYSYINKVAGKSLSLPSFQSNYLRERRETDTERYSKLERERERERERKREREREREKERERERERERYRQTDRWRDFDGRTDRVMNRLRQ